MTWLIRILIPGNQTEGIRDTRCDVVSSCLNRAIGLWVLCGGNLASTGPTSCPRERMSRLSSHNRSVIKASTHVKKYQYAPPLYFPLPHHINSSWYKQKLQFVLSDGSSPEVALSKRILSPEELSQQLEKLLLEDMASDEQIFDWVEVWEVTQVWQKCPCKQKNACCSVRHRLCSGFLTGSSRVRGWEHPKIQHGSSISLLQAKSSHAEHTHAASFSTRQLFLTWVFTLIEGVSCSCVFPGKPRWISDELVSLPEGFDDSCV